jgi:transposase
VEQEAASIGRSFKKRQRAGAVKEVIVPIGSSPETEKRSMSSAVTISPTMTEDDRRETIEECNQEHPLDENTSAHETKSPTWAVSEVQEALSDLPSQKELDGTEVRMYKDIDIDNLEWLYHEEGLSQRALADHFDVGRKVIQDIFRKFEIDARSVGFQKIDLDADEVYDLYFNKGWTLREMAQHFQCESTDPILRVMDENGWKTKYQQSLEIVGRIDPEEVYELYHQEGYSIKKIGEIYGVSYGPILRIFKENNWDYGQEIHVDLEQFYHLYFEQGLSKEETGERLGVSRKVIDRVLDEHEEWEARPAGFQSAEIDLDEFKRLYYDEEMLLEDMAKRFEVSERTIVRFRKEHDLRVRDRATIRSLRDSLFGTECVFCGRKRKFIHRKDGAPHPSEILWRREDLLALDPDDWAALCRPCHRLTHSLMRNYGCEWSEIEETLMKLAGKKAKPLK